MQFGRGCLFLSPLQRDELWVMPIRCTGCPPGIVPFLSVLLKTPWRSHWEMPRDPGVHSNCLLWPRAAFSWLLTMKITLSPLKEAGHLLKSLISQWEPRTWIPLVRELLTYPWLAAWAGSDGHSLHASLHAHMHVYVFRGRSWGVFSAFNTKVKNARLLVYKRKKKGRNKKPQLPKAQVWHKEPWGNFHHVFNVVSFISLGSPVC